MKMMITAMLLSMASISNAQVYISCSIEKANSMTGFSELTQVNITQNQRLEIQQGLLEGTIQVVADHLAQVMVTDKENYVFNQEDPRTLHATGAGRAFLQSFTSGDSLSISCK